MPEAQNLSSRIFEYAGRGAACCSASAATLEWAEEFLGPWFAARAGLATSRSPLVDVRVDAKLFHDRLRATPPGGRSVACFTLDQAQELLPVVLDEGAVDELAIDGTWGFALSVVTDGRGERAIHVLAESERPAGRLALMRVLRELASAQAASLGELPLHAAAVAEPEGVTLFVGGKGAGKTTLLVRALASGETRYVANDRVFVRLGSGAPIARGMPSIVSLREATLAISASLQGAADSGAWHYASTIAESYACQSAGTRPEGAGRRTPPGLSPAQLCALLGVSPVADGALVRLVFPETQRTREGGSGFSLRRLTPGAAAARVLESGLLAGGRSATWVSGTPPPERNSLESGVRELVARVACFSCVLGPDACASPSAWQALQDAWK